MKTYYIEHAIYASVGLVSRGYGVYKADKMTLINIQAIKARALEVAQQEAAERSENAQILSTLSLENVQIISITLLDE